MFILCRFKINATIQSCQTLLVLNILFLCLIGAKPETFCETGLFIYYFCLCLCECFGPWGPNTASPLPRVWWSACVSPVQCSDGLHLFLSWRRRASSAPCASTRQESTPLMSSVSFVYLTPLPQDTCALWPCQKYHFNLLLKNLQFRLQFCHTVTVSLCVCVRQQIAAGRMNSSHSFSPSPPLWTISWRYRVVSSSTTLVPQWRVCVQCECSSSSNDLNDWLRRNRCIYSVFEHSKSNFPAEDQTVSRVVGVMSWQPFTSKTTTGGCSLFCIELLVQGAASALYLLAARPLAWWGCGDII